MAVAAESHRDFLIPERILMRPTTNTLYSDAMCLFFCGNIISHICEAFNPFYISASKRANMRGIVSAEARWETIAIPDASLVSLP